MMEGVSSWPAVSGAQFMTHFQGKAKKVLFQMPCRPYRRMDKAFSCSGKKVIQKLCYSDPSHSFSQNITLKVTCFDRALSRKRCIKSLCSFVKNIYRCRKEGTVFPHIQNINTSFINNCITYSIILPYRLWISAHFSSEKFFTSDFKQIIYIYSFFIFSEVW